jgi:outer membrane protein assembly factor BamB
VVYTLNRKGELRGYTLDGDSCFFNNLETTIEASFIAVDSTLYIGRTDGFVTALPLRTILSLHIDEESERTSSLLWEFETFGQISGSPNFVGDQLLVGSYDGSMYTVDAQTGRETAQFQTDYYINGTAAVWKGYMMFGGCDAWIRVVDVATGIMTDSLELDSYVPASPAIMDDIAVACDYNGNVYEMMLDGGTIVSHRKIIAADTDKDGEDGGVVSMPTLTHDAVYILSGERHITCIDRESGKTRWKKMLRGMTGECAPLVARDKVLVCTKDGHISILNTADGSERWHYETGEQIIASPAIISNRFFILTARGTLLCFA